MRIQVTAGEGEVPNVRRRLHPVWVQCVEQARGGTPRASVPTQDKAVEPTEEGIVVVKCAAHPERRVFRADALGPVEENELAQRGKQLRRADHGGDVRSSRVDECEADKCGKGKGEVGSRGVERVGMAVLSRLVKRKRDLERGEEIE